MAESKDELNDGEIFTATYAIPKDKAEQMLQVIDNAAAVDTIPDDAYIADWKMGFDGIDYKLQQKKDSTYTFKSYWSPFLFKELPQAIVIQHFTDELLNIVDYKNLHSGFHNQVPFNMYSEGSNYTIGKIVIATKEYKKKKREARRRKRKMKE